LETQRPQIAKAMSQGNSLYSYLKQTKISFFFTYKNKREKQVQSGGVDTNRRGQKIGKGNANTVYACM
jgi:hypothetical protein